jgi:hypothetical protein
MVVYYKLGRKRQEMIASNCYEEISEYDLLVVAYKPLKLVSPLFSPSISRLHNSNSHSFSLDDPKSLLMEAPTQSFAVYSTSATQHNQHLAATNQLHAPMTESSWHTNHLVAQPMPASSAQPSGLFSAANRPPDLDYPSPVSSTTSPSLSQHHNQSENYPNHHHSPSFPLNSSNEAMFTPFHQVESSIGPSRVLTRRQRAALAQGTHARRASMPSSFQRPEPHSTPVCLAVYRYFSLA